MEQQYERPDSDFTKVWEKVARSVKGDEIIFFQGQSWEDTRVLTYVALGKDSFKEASIEMKPNGMQSISLKNPELKTADVMDAIQKVPMYSTKIYWNRRKFMSDEVDKMAEGALLPDYRQITMEYSPMKVLADQKVRIAQQLKEMAPGTEISYVKYRNGHRAGVQYYICMEPEKFISAHKSTLEGPVKKRFVCADRDFYSTEDIVAQLPKDMSELSSDHCIEITQKVGKYKRSEIFRLANKHELLDDIAIENRRRLDFSTEKTYTRIKNEPGAYIQHWLDKETHKIVRNQTVFLNETAVENLKEKNKILDREVEITKSYDSYRPQAGLYVEYWTVKGLQNTLKKSVVELSAEQVEEYKRNGQFRANPERKVDTSRHEQFRKAPRTVQISQTAQTHRGIRRPSSENRSVER